MSFPAAVVERVMLAMLLNGTGMPERKTQLGLGLTALSVFLGLAGCGFLMAAGYGYLQEYFDARTATLYMALITLGCALACSLVGYALIHYRQKRMRAVQSTIADNLRSALASVTDELEGPIRDNPKTAALLAGLAGFAAAQRLH